MSQLKDRGEGSQRPPAHVSAQPLSRAVSDHPGGLAFPVGSGRGQWGILAAIAAATAVAVVTNAGWAMVAMVLICLVCAVLRLTLPASAVPALVNRGKAFDVLATLAWAVALGAILLSGVHGLWGA